MKSTSVPRSSSPASNSDIAAYQSNKIAIVPMNVTEHDSGLLELLRQRLSKTLAWNPSDRE